MRLERGKKLEEILEQGIQGGVYVGAAGGYTLETGETSTFYVGRTLEGGAGDPICDDTFFDLASLTKVVSTTSIAARLVAQGLVDLSGQIVAEFPELSWHQDWGSVVVRDLLNHTAGFPAYENFSEKLIGDPQQILNPGSLEMRQAILTSIAISPAQYVLGEEVVYSDLGFILLGEYLARISSATLDKLFEQEVRTPLKVGSLVSKPLELGISRQRIAATEEVAWRGGLVHGDVHDDNAYLLGGLSGHAGLFGNLKDVLKLGFAWLRSVAGDSSYIPSDVSREFVSPVQAENGSKHALGWDLPVEKGSQAGEKCSERTVGHLGFTGTSIWIDLERRAVSVLLTNRVHPSSRNDKIRPFRPRVHDAVWELVER